MVIWLISIVERVDHSDIKNLNLTTSGYVNSWLAVFLRGMWKIFFVHLNVWLMMWKLLWQLFFLASCSTPCLDMSLSNMVWYNSPRKSTLAQVFFFFFLMNLECLKLDLHSKLELHELKFQKTGILLFILQTVVCC